MKVLMTADTVGGVWTYALQLCRALAPLGVEVALAAKGGRPSPAQRAAAARLPNLTLFESDFRLEWQDEPWEDVARAGEWLLELEARLRPDAVHLNDYAHGALPFRAPALVVGHSCVVSWWEAVRRTPLPARWFRYRTEVRAGIRGAAAVVAPSAAMLRALERHYGPLPFGRVIYNGRALEGGPGPLDASRREPLIFAAGRLWDEAKNVAALGRVAGLLPWTVAVAGDARGAALEGVRLLGPLPAAELESWLRRAAIYALPARYEPFGLSILEAALAGCALVLGDIPSQRELWEGAAELVPLEDPGALAFALGRLARDPARRGGMAAAARRRAGRYAPDRMAAAYLELYRELARRSHTRTLEVSPACASSSSVTR